MLCASFFCVLLAFVIGLIVGQLVGSRQFSEKFNAIAGRGIINTDNTAAACRFGVVSPTQLSSFGSACCAVYHKQDGLYKPVEQVGKCCTLTNDQGTQCLQYDMKDDS